jgi:hypothetical protein
MQNGLRFASISHVSEKNFSEKGHPTYQNVIFDNFCKLFYARYLSQSHQHNTDSLGIPAILISSNFYLKIFLSIVGY